MLPRMRTRDKCIEMLRELDPDTHITRSSLDYLVREGHVPSTNVGNRILINFDLLLKLLYEGTGTQPPQEAPTGVIRKIEV